MGKITTDSNAFIPASFIYNKIKREFKKFASVNLLDDVDSPEYTMEVLRQLGNGSLAQQDAVLILNNGRTPIPKNFVRAHALYRCENINNASNIHNKEHQGRIILEDDVSCEALCRSNNCETSCDSDDKIINRITIKRYVHDNIINYNYGKLGLLHLSPNVRPQDEKGPYSRGDEYSIYNDYIFTNFDCDAIYIQYYGYPMDNDGLPMIPNNTETERAVEWHIKHQLLLNFWLVDDLANALNKWQKAETEANKWLAEAKHHNKVPSFEYLVNSIREKRSINAVMFFSQIDRRNISVV